MCTNGQLDSTYGVFTPYSDGKGPLFVLYAGVGRKNSIGVVQQPIGTHDAARREPGST